MFFYSLLFFGSAVTGFYSFLCKKSKKIHFGGHTSYRFFGPAPNLCDGQWCKQPYVCKYLCVYVCIFCMRVCLCVCFCHIVFGVCTCCDVFFSMIIAFGSFLVSIPHTHKRTSISKCKKFTRMRVNLLPKFTRVFFTPQIYSHASKFSPQIYPQVRTL